VTQRIPLRLPSLNDFGVDARRLLLVSGLTAVNYLGIYNLLRTLYVLRLGFSAEYMGIYLSAGALTFMAMGVPSGALGARFGTRRIMLLGGWTMVIGMAIFPFAEFLPLAFRSAWPLVTQMVLTIGWSMFTVNQVPALMGATTVQNRSPAYAMTSAVRSFGTFLGSLVGGILPGIFAALLGRSTDTATPYSASIWVGAALGLGALVPLMRIEVGRPVHPSQARLGRRSAFPVLAVALMVGYVYLRHAGWAACQAYCNPYMDAGLRYSTLTIGVINGVGQVAAMAASLLLPRWTERLSHRWILIASTLGVSGSMALLSIIPHWAAVGAGIVGIQVFSAIWLPTLQIFQMETIASSWRGLAYGATTMAMGLGFGSMSLVGGYAIEARGYRPVFLAGVILTVVATPLLAALLRKPSEGGDELPAESHVCADMPALQDSDVQHGIAGRQEPVSSDGRAAAR